MKTSRCAEGVANAARVAHVARVAFVAFAVATVGAACSDSTGSGAVDDTTAPPGPDVTQPYSIDRGDDPGTPGP